MSNIPKEIMTMDESTVEDNSFEIIDVSSYFENEVKYKKILFDISKRFFDILLSIILFVFAVPVMMIFAILIKLESNGSVFYSQKRVGLNGKEFKIYKLRSMIENAETNGAVWAIASDPRVTNVGKFIRKTRIDELPQLVNVLKGEMSIIGPRPERKVFIEEFSVDIPRFKERTKVKPGLTGLAQVTGGYDLTPAQKLSFDLYYIEKKSIIFEMVILIKTVKVIFKGDGAR